MSELSENKSGSAIPCRIFMLWDSGWQNAPDWNKLCLESWKQFNPHHTVLALDLEWAEELSEVKNYIDTEKWESASIQAKSDVLRVLLLWKFGGFWVDASTACNRPLGDWVDDHRDFILFHRNDNHAKTLYAGFPLPWMATWFMAAPNGSFVIENIKDAVVKH